MKPPEDLQPGSLVVSRAGRDKGKLFAVVRLEGEFAYLADGDLRKLEKPKRKKRRHLAGTCGALGPLAQRLAAGDPVYDAELRKALKEIRGVSPEDPSTRRMTIVQTGCH